jgi:hypothetical protein
MTEHKTYTTAGAFRRALEERLKKTSQTDQTDINRLRRQVSFDRLLARLFRDDSVPWVLKGGYALELRFKTARSTVDIDLTMGRVEDATDSSDVNQVVREILQAAASLPLGDWFEYTIGSPMMDITAAPYGGARYPVEVRMDGRIFAKFHLDAGIGDIVIHPVEIIETRDWLAFRRNRTVASAIDCPRTTVRRKDSRIHAATQYSQQSCEGSSGYGASDRRQHIGLAEDS